MKKIIILFLATISYLFSPALALSDTYYRILLKNGGRLTTPTYWQKDAQTYFIYSNGIVGIEKNLIKSIEKYERETSAYQGAVSANTGESESVSSPPTSEKEQGQERIPVATEGEEKVNVADYKRTKDKLLNELNELLEKQREAASKGDNEAKAKIGEEIVRYSNQVYKLTDEVKAKNKGKLPEGW